MKRKLENLYTITDLTNSILSITWPETNFQKYAQPSVHSILSACPHLAEIKVLSNEYKIFPMTCAVIANNIPAVKAFLNYKQKAEEEHKIMLGCAAYVENFKMVEILFKNIKISCAISNIEKPFFEFIKKVSILADVARTFYDNSGDKRYFYTIMGWQLKDEKGYPLIRYNEDKILEPKIKTQVRDFYCALFCCYLEYLKGYFEEKQKEEKIEDKAITVSTPKSIKDYVKYQLADDLQKGKLKETEEALFTRAQPLESLAEEFSTLKKILDFAKKANTQSSIVPHVEEKHMN